MFITDQLSIPIKQGECRDDYRLLDELEDLTDEMGILCLAIVRIHEYQISDQSL